MSDSEAPGEKYVISAFHEKACQRPPWWTTFVGYLKLGVPLTIIPTLVCVWLLRVLFPGVDSTQGGFRMQTISHLTVSAQAKNIARILIFAILTFVVASVFLVGMLRFLPPPTSAFMVKRQLDGLFQQDKSPRIHYQWIDREFISPHIALAVVASEDQKFPHHWGFDFQSISEALEERRMKGRVRGASTITQQTAKNLFLWEGRSFVRKGFEAWFTVLMEALWPKRRILEIYLNIVEFGDGVYGVRSAAMIFFGKEPSQLTRREAALMAAVLPNPKRFSVAAPSGYMHQRTRQIERQMINLGDSYLKSL